MGGEDESDHIHVRGSELASECVRPASLVMPNPHGGGGYQNVNAGVISYGPQRNKQKQSNPPTV